MNKYQFYISFDNKPGTASSKAIDDCTTILSSMGYRNYNLATNVTSRFYLLSVLSAVTKLLLNIRPNAIVAVQYPLLSGNKLFSYIIRLLHVKNVKVIGIVHDLNDLRYQQSANSKVYSDAELLNDYDVVIVHNQAMIGWLKDKGVTSSLIPLDMFDYLSSQPYPVERAFSRTIVFAGNLAKSTFIYDLDLIIDWQFNFYGPNIQLSKLNRKKNLHWGGAFSADDILIHMEGAFGMIWDGTDISALDEIYGNYLRFNNPHKLSLYLAAGLPVIVPESAAIAAFVKRYQIGLTLPDLTALNSLKISENEYLAYSRNARCIGNDLKKGFYLRKAILKAENHFNINR